MKLKYPHLCSPVTIRGITLKNRILSAPMGIWAMCPENGVPESTLKYFEERAAGGAATVVLGDTQVNAGDPEDEKVGKILHIRTPDAPIALLTEFADRARQHGSLASIELSHVGRGLIPPGPEGAMMGNMMARMQGRKTGPGYSIFYGPVGYKTAVTETIQMTKERIKMTIGYYVECAAVLKRCGFQMITIHGAHGKLIDQFLEPGNTRDDEYGGSLENRMRFAIEVIDAVRQVVGENFIIEMRVSSHDTVKEKQRFEELITLVNRLEGKIDILNVSTHSMPGGDSEHVMMPGYLQAPAPNVIRAAVVKERVNVPVSAVGAIISPEVAEEIIASGKADFVAMGRPLLADPEFGNKARRGREDDIRQCIGCNKCLDVMHMTHVIRCSVNPRAGKEYSTPAGKAAVKKKVAVIGGGVAGMQAAITAADRGHDVTLFEKSGRLGGMLAYFAGDDLKYRLNNLRDYFIRQVNKSGISVKLNTNATGAMITKLAPDAIILAAGSNPCIPNIKGAGGKNVLDVRETYDRIDNMPKRVAIIGGNLGGCELAASLNKHGNQVTIVEMMPRLAPDSRMMDSALVKLLKGVTAETDACCTEIRNNGVVFKRGNKEQFVEADVVVLAVGMSADRSLVDKLRFAAPEFAEAGDCSEVATVTEAIRSGYYAALDI